VKEAGGELLVDVEPARVRCSEGLLRQVLWNLGENAVKYRRHSVTPRIELVGRGAGATYQFRVSDNGAGMSAEDARRAFEPFYRGAQTGEAPGTGLGLAIVKRVIQAAGGALTVDSKPGQGSTFRFTLPLGT
jgi:signal transduction histidine kinase